MEIRKLVIADSSEEFRLALAELVRGGCHVRLCQDGNQTLETVQSMKPDVLVLDLLMPGLDGISILQKLHSAGIHPLVLATTGFTNDYVLDTLEAMGVCYVMRKPCNLYAVAARIEDLYHHVKPQSVTGPDARTMVCNMLLSLGIPTKLKGYACLREAILEQMRDSAQQITKELYPKVGKLCDANKNQVERSIRSAIAKAWETRDEGVWRLYFQGAAGEKPERPSNAVFISAIADRLGMDRDG